MTETKDPHYALLTDGTAIEIRPLRAEDVDAVRRMHRMMSPESLYLRFFSFSPSAADRTAELLCRPPGPLHNALSAWLCGELVGVAGYEPAGEGGEVAELAMAVADRMHHRGVGTLLLEHLGSLARREGVREFRADTLARNHPMLRVAAHAGMAVRRHAEAGVVEMRLSLDPDQTYLDAVAERERRADVASLAHLLHPESVVVVGAGRRPGSVGRAVLRSLRSSAYVGRVYAVNPHAGDTLLGAVCAATIADLPEAPELAILAVPAAAVGDTAAACGRRGVRALVVLTSGLDREVSDALRTACHTFGMRLVGPNCLGIANTVVDLDATFALNHPLRGSAGVVVQSGGVGIAVLEQFARLGIGVSSFVSAGDKYDVSATDLLQWWESDAATRLGVIHVESFGNPRKFARTARRVARSMPLLTVVAGRSAAGRRAAASHTAAAATPTVTQEALFAQAGVVATHGLGELVGAAALLAHQSAPAGPRVAIVSNAGGAGVLAADACADAGLTVVSFSGRTLEILAGLLPDAAGLSGPVDTTAAVEREVFHRCLEVVAADPAVDAVLAVTVPTAVGVLTAGTPSGKPLVAVRLDQAESVTVESGVASFAVPEDAVRALAHAWEYGRWLARPPGTAPAHADADRGRVTAIIAGHLAAHPDGGWLPPAEAMELLAAYGLPMADWRWAADENEAVAASAELGGRVALKAHVPGIVHKSAAGAVRLDLRNPGEVRDAYAMLRERFQDRMEGVLVQSMSPGGSELLCGVVQEPVFGPLVVLGLGGTSADALGRRTARLTPLTDVDAAEMTRELPVPVGPEVEEVLTRLGRLADEHPEIAELDLNPVIETASGPVAVDARVRLAPARTWDPFLRCLR